MAVLSLVGDVIPERRSANSSEMVAGGIHKEHSKTNGQVEVGVVIGERLRPNGHVKVASGVAGKCRLHQSPRYNCR